MHSQTRSRLVVEKLHDLGLRISYDRMLVLSTELENSVCRQFESDGVVSPTKLCSNIFTTFAVDNIDHNPSSRSAKSSWHETTIFSTRHLESDTDGIKRCFVQLAATASKVLQSLPKEYTIEQCTLLF